MDKIVFMSHPLTEDTPTYGNRDKFTIKKNSEIVNGFGANTSTFTFSNNHMGTHLDTPFHFCSNGRRTLDYHAADFFFQKVAVIECPCNRAKLICMDDLDLHDVSNDVEFLLIDTDYEQYRPLDKYHNDNPGFHPNLADNLRKKFKNLRAIGFDSISLTSWKFRPAGRESHTAFLCGQPPILIVEDVSFKELRKKEIDWLIVAPLRTSDGNGGPVTIMAKIKQ